MATTGYKCGPLCGLEAGVCVHGSNWAAPLPGVWEERRAEFPNLVRSLEVRGRIPGSGGRARLREAARVLASLPELRDSVAGWNAAHPTHPKGGDGKWSHTPGGAVSSAVDKLKLAGRIDLDPGERLLGTDEVTGVEGSARLAWTDKGGSRSLRLGLSGREDDDADPWSGGNDGSTARLDAPAVQRLRATLDDALAAGERKQREVDAAYAAGHPPVRPAAGYWEFGSGSIPGEQADVHYLVQLDENLEIYLGAVPHGSGLDFDDMIGNEQAVKLSPAQARKLLRLLGSGDQSTRSALQERANAVLASLPDLPLVRGN